MKILIISDAWHPQVNGVVRTYEHIMEELIDLGHDVKVIGPEDFSWKMSMPGYQEIKLVWFPYRRLSKMIEEYQPDAIHISVEGPLGWAARRYCLKNKVQFSTSYHTHFPHYAEERMPKNSKFLRKHARRWGRWYVRTFHMPSSAMMVASPSLERILRRWKFQNNIYRLTRGVNTDVFYPGEKTLFHDLTKPVALYVGRVAVEKNLEAFLAMDWEGSKIIVGDGPSMYYLKKKYPEAIFAGKKNPKELGEYYRSSDLFVFPSKTDTFGIVLLEALACGIPVAAYPVTGPKDIIIEDYLGSLDEDLATAAKQALNQGSSEVRSEYISENYGWRLAAEQFLKAIQH